MKDVVGVILAAGEGTRMKSAVPKVLHNLWGMPVLLHTIRALKCAGIDRIIAVVGYKSERIKEHLKGFEIVTQKELLGTADALYRTRKALSGFDGTILVVCADAPLIKTDTILKLIHMHRDEQAACSLLSAELRDPTGYGRIIRNSEGEIVRIVEENDASIYQRVVSEVNSGAYCFDSKKLFAALNEIMLSAKKGEYYLTDTVDFFKRHKDKIAAHVTDDPSEIIGINSRKDLALAHDILRKRIIEDIISNGVTVIDPGTAFISSNVTIGQDTVIYPFVFIEADVSIGKNCSVGPFCRIRSGTTIEDETRVGNFVEITRSHIKRGTKINHFSYLGDAAVGSKVNIGAGTVTANYNGKSKNKTFIGNDAFIGSGTILIAPVRIGDYATTGAGCVVPKEKNIPKGSVAIGVPARILKKSNRSHSK